MTPPRFRVEHAAVQTPCPGFCNFADIVGQQLAQRNARTRSPLPLRSTMVMCETSKIPALHHARHGALLLRAVVQRHIPAAEVDDLGAGVDVFARKAVCSPMLCPIKLLKTEVQKKGRQTNPVRSAAPLSFLYLRDQWLLAEMPPYPFGGPPFRPLSRAQSA